MKSKPEKSQGLRLIAISFLGIGIVTFLFFQTQATHEKEHAQIQEQLRDAQQIDSNLDEEVLSLRFRLAGSCDAVTAKEAQLSNAQTELESAIERGYPQRLEDIDNGLRDYRKILKQKLDLVEKFKATNAILTNSLNYYPLANTRIRSIMSAARAPASLIPRIDRLEHNILLFNLTRDADLKNRTEAQVADLCRAYRFCPPQAQADLAGLLKHAHSILRRKSETDVLLATIVTLPTDSANDRLYAVEQSHYRQARRISSRYRIGIYVACMLLICYIASILMHLNRHQKALALSNQMLEERVQQRTLALQESQERYETAVSGSNEGIWDWDLLSGVSYFSPRYKEMLGFTEEEFPNRPESFYERLHPDDANKINQAMQEHLSGAAPYLIDDFRMQLKGGEYRWFHGRGQALRDAEGKPYRVAGSITDITDRKLLETQLAHAQKMESIGQLAAGIAHEINTPIQYIGDNIRFLKEGFQALQELRATSMQLMAAAVEHTEPAELAAQMQAAAEEADIDYFLDEIPRAVSQSLEGVERVSNIVRAMKEFSHPGTAEKTRTDLNHAIESTITVARNEWKYAAEIVMDFDPKLPLVPCLPGDINQVFLNLIVNAAHAIEDVVRDSGEKGVITITTRREGDRAEIRVRDTGTGIPEAVRAHIFDPFFTTKEVGKGTGQGLAIAHTIVVDKHEGTIHFETEPGKGTTFILRLPLHTREDLSLHTQDDLLQEAA